MSFFMNNETEVSHDGRVVEKLDDMYRVKIISRSACSQCHAKGICSASDMAEKFIDVVSNEELEVGDDVKVIMEEKLGWIALFYSFILPFIIMISVLILSHVLGCIENVCALLAIGSLAPYYIALFLFRNKISKDFVFRAEKRKKLIQRGEW